MPANGPLILKNLDDYKTWPVKHRHWYFDIVEDEHHDIWIHTGHLRSFWSKFPTDKALKTVHHRHMLYDKESKAHYLPVRAMQREMQRCSEGADRTDILRFLDWFQRNVIDVTAKKRINQHLDNRNAARDVLEATVTAHQSSIYLSGRQEESTLPLTPEERWRLEHEGTDIPRVYHLEARPIRVTWTEFWIQWWQRRGEVVLEFVQGRRNLVGTTILLAILLSWLIYVIDSVLIPSELDWTVSYRRVAWSHAFLSLLSLLFGALYAYSLSRGLRRIWQERRHRITGTVWYLMTISFAWTLPDAVIATDMLDYWWASVRGHARPVQIYADPYLGRLVLRNAIEFGSAEALEAALRANPRYTLLELESPGGYVVEGMRMERIVREHHLDTVVMGACASACTIVYAGGTDRYLGPEAKMLFHRSGRPSNFIDYGWTATDYAIQKIWLDRGVEPDFTRAALKEPMFRIWLAPTVKMLDAKFATAFWADRKPGY